MEVHLSLKAEKEEICLRKFEDVFNIQPDWHLNWDNGVKAWNCEFEDLPQVVIPIVGLVIDECKSCIDLWGQPPGDEVGEEFHQRFTHGRVARDTKSGDAQAFKMVAEHHGVERHNGHEVCWGDLVETVVKVYHLISRDQLEHGEEPEQMLEDPIDLGGYSVGCQIHPKLINTLMGVDDVVKACQDIVGSDVQVPATLEECGIDVSGAVMSTMVIEVGRGRYVEAAGSKLMSVTFVVHILGQHDHTAQG